MFLLFFIQFFSVAYTLAKLLLLRLIFSIQDFAIGRFYYRYCLLLFFNLKHMDHSVLRIKTGKCHQFFLFFFFFKNLPSFPPTPAWSKNLQFNNTGSRVVDPSYELLTNTNQLLSMVSTIMQDFIRDHFSSPDNSSMWQGNAYSILIQ